MKKVSSASAKPAAKRSTKAVPKSRAKAARAPARKRTRKSATDVAIATDLAPAVAIALLDKTGQAEGSPAPALDCMAAGVSASEDEGKVRVQLMFENGAVLPVEMSNEAGAALSSGLSDELKGAK